MCGGERNGLEVLERISEGPRISGVAAGGATATTTGWLSIILGRATKRTALVCSAIGSPIRLSLKSRSVRLGGPKKGRVLASSDIERRLTRTRRAISFFR